MILLLSFVKSDIGLIRKRNEDSFAFEPPHIFVVADGMGGHVAGEIASATAASVVKDYCLSHLGDVHPQQLLEQAILEANRIVFSKASLETEYAGMGTTVTAAFLTDSSLYWGHVGDSRLYYAYQDSMTQLTSDHTLVWEMMRNGAISPEEALIHPQRNMLTRAVGTTDYIRVETGVCHYQDQSRFLLCTDGLTNMVADSTVAALLLDRNLNGQTILDTLVTEANKAGGHDNVTAILLDL